MRLIILILCLIPTFAFGQLDKIYNVKAISNLLDGNPDYPIMIKEDVTGKSFYLLTDSQMQLFVETFVERYKLAIANDSLQQDLVKYRIIDDQHVKFRDYHKRTLQNISNTNVILADGIKGELKGLYFRVDDVGKELVDLNSYISKDKDKLKKQKWWIIPLAVVGGISCSRLNIETECLVGSGIMFGGWSLFELF